MDYREELFRLCRLVILDHHKLPNDQNTIGVAYELETKILTEVYAEMSDEQFLSALKDISAEVIAKDD